MSPRSPVRKTTMLIHSSSNRSYQRGFTLVELLIVISVLAILMSIAIPNLVSSRISADESSAISALRAISRGMEAYKIRNRGGDNGYPSDYKALVTVRPPDIDPVLATGVRTGYAFSGGGDVTQYAVIAVPVHFGTSGRRSFYVDETGVIRGCEKGGEPAGPTDSPIN